jgi:CheY-like chemotaxis protein
MLLEEDAGNSRLAERAAKIRRAAERCAKIVQTFLALARQKPPERRRVDLNAIVSAALDLTGYGMRTAGIDVVCELTPGLPMLDADGDQLHQVFANLLVNAQQALHETDHPRRLTIATRRAARPGMLEVEVADNGPGIPPELRRRVMEPFFTTKPQGVGTGLGLSYSLGVVEAHGGQLELVDTADGAVFRVTLPAVEEAPPGPTPDGAVAVPAASAGRALVVDDEPEIADMLAEILEGQGYRVRIAASGEDAKAQLAVRDFDLVLSDLRMPGIDGPTLYAWVRAERPHLLPRFGFVTGDTMGPAAVRFLAESGVPSLEKPFTPKGLRNFVEKVRERANA